MKKIVMLSTMAFDANVSIIKRLKDKYDLHVLFLCNSSLSSLNDIKINKHIVPASQIKDFHLLKSFLDLDKCYLIQHFSPKSIQRYIVAIKVYQLLSQLQPDNIITDAQTFQFFLSRFIYRKRTISIVHDPFPHSGENSLTKRAIKIFQKNISNKYILLNQSQKNDFIKEFKINPKNVYTTFLSEYEFYKIYDNFSSNPQSKNFRILFFGRISPYKGISYLLEACKKIIDEGINIEVIIAGKGEFDFEITPYLDNHRITIINKMVSSSEMVKLIKNTDIVICPYTDATQSGVIMTSYAFNKPIIATKVGGLPEMLNNGKTGYLIEPKNVNEIYNAIIHLKENNNKLIEYQKNIQNIYRNGEKSWNNAIQHIINCIEDF